MLYTQEQSHQIRTQVANKSFENVALFRYMETAVTNQNYIPEEIKMRLDSGNACYNADENCL